jgi:hypothetical protein
VVVAAVAATILVAGIIGQAAAAAAAEEENPPTSPIELETQVGQGPTTEPAPEPAPAPGPTPDASESPDDTSASVSPSLSQAQAGAVPAFAPLALDGGLDPTDAPDDGTTTSGSTVDLGNGYSFELPEGYTVEQQGDGFAMVFGDNGYFIVQLTPPPADLETMITDNLATLQALGIQDLQIGDPEAIQIPSSAVVQCVTLGFRGMLASEQSGSLAVEGFSYYFLTQEGTGVTAFGIYQAGLAEGDPLIDGYISMLNSLIASF